MPSTVRSTTGWKADRIALISHGVAAKTAMRVLVCPFKDSGGRRPAGVNARPERDQFL